MLVRWLVSLALAGCWIASLCLPVAVTVAQNGEQGWFGYGILIMGWLGPLMLQFGWFANLLLPSALILNGLAERSALTQKILIVIALALTMLAVNALFWNQIPMDNGSNPIVRFQIGYFLWLAAMFGGGAFTLASAISALRSRED
jgi:hypothetical protein